MGSNFRLLAVFSDKRASYGVELKLYKDPKSLKPATHLKPTFLEMGVLVGTSFLFRGFSIYNSTA